jgi:hypothetical protein
MEKLEKGQETEENFKSTFNEIKDQLSEYWAKNNKSSQSSNTQSQTGRRKQILKDSNQTEQHLKPNINRKEKKATIKNTKHKQPKEIVQTKKLQTSNSSPLNILDETLKKIKEQNTLSFQGASKQRRMQPMGENQENGDQTPSSKQISPQKANTKHKTSKNAQILENKLTHNTRTQKYTKTVSQNSHIQHQSSQIPRNTQNTGVNLLNLSNSSNSSQNMNPHPNKNIKNSFKSNVNIPMSQQSPLQPSSSTHSIKNYQLSFSQISDFQPPSVQTLVHARPLRNLNSERERIQRSRSTSLTAPNNFDHLINSQTKPYFVKPKLQRERSCGDQLNQNDLQINFDLSNKNKENLINSSVSDVNLSYQKLLAVENEWSLMKRNFPNRSNSGIGEILPSSLQKIQEEKLTQAKRELSTPFLKSLGVGPKRHFTKRSTSTHSIYQRARTSGISFHSHNKSFDLNKEAEKAEILNFFGSLSPRSKLHQERLSKKHNFIHESEKEQERRAKLEVTRKSIGSPERITITTNQKEEKNIKADQSRKSDVGCQKQGETQAKIDEKKENTEEQNEERKDKATLFKEKMLDKKGIRDRILKYSTGCFLSPSHLSVSLGKIRSNSTTHQHIINLLPIPNPSSNANMLQKYPNQLIQSNNRHVGLFYQRNTPSTSITSDSNQTHNSNVSSYILRKHSSSKSENESSEFSPSGDENVIDDESTCNHIREFEMNSLNQ